MSISKLRSIELKIFLGLVIAIGLLLLNRRPEINGPAQKLIFQKFLFWLTCNSAMDLEVSSPSDGRPAEVRQELISE